LSNPESKRFPYFLPKTPPIIDPPHERSTSHETGPQTEETAKNTLREVQQELQRVIPGILKYQDSDSAATITFEIVFFCFHKRKELWLISTLCQLLIAETLIWRVIIRFWHPKHAATWRFGSMSWCFQMSFCENNSFSIKIIVASAFDFF
jgi:hypothetical protein